MANVITVINASNILKLTLKLPLIFRKGRLLIDKDGITVNSFAI